jgi:hypothetical protein
MAKKRSSRSQQNDENELKRRGMFVGNKPTASIGGGYEFSPQYKNPGGAGGRTLASPEALIAEAERKDEMSRSGMRDARLLRIRQESAARKQPKRR